MFALALAHTPHKTATLPAPGPQTWCSRASQLHPPRHRPEPMQPPSAQCALLMACAAHSLKSLATRARLLSTQVYARAQLPFAVMTVAGGEAFNRALRCVLPSPHPPAPAALLLNCVCRPSINGIATRGLHLRAALCALWGACMRCPQARPCRATSGQAPVLPALVLLVL